MSNSKTVSTFHIATGMSVAVSLASSMAVAQTSENSSGGISSILEEVTVTARKQEEGLQDAPLAVTAFTGESLDARGITNISEVGLITPNMNYQNNPVAGGSSSVATVYIRGIGQRDFLGTIDNGVGFYIDDVIVARTVGAVVDLLDVERIEVLRGPQGTLFGRNNVGGAVKLHTRAPGNEFLGYVDGQVGTDGMLRLKASVDVPFSESFTSTFSILDSQQDGYVDRPAGGDLGDENVTALRAAFRLDASESVTADLSFDYSNQEVNGPAFVLHDAGELAPGGFAGFHNNVTEFAQCNYGEFGPFAVTGVANPACYNNQWLAGTDTNLGTAPTFSDTRTWGTRLGLEWQINDNWTLKSITAYRDLDAQFAKDSDASPLKIVHFFDDFVTEQFSQELQLIGSLADGKIDWITGLYYFDEDGENLNLLEFAIADFQSGAGFGTESEAFFTQATWHATDKLDVTVGGRYTDETKLFDPDQFVGPNLIGIPYTDSAGACVVQDEGANIAAGNPGFVATIPGENCPVRQLPLGENERNTTEFNPMVNVAYQVSDELMTYATYSEGFRSGGFVQRVFPPLPSVFSFDPEFVDSYEIGAKYRSEDGALTLNVAAFFMDYTDIQVRTEIPGFVGELEDNIGDAEIKGFEVEAIVGLTNSTILEFAYGYTDAEYTAIRVEPGLSSTVGLDDSFDHVPEHSASAALSSEFSMESGASIVARLDVSYQSEYANDPDNSAEIFTPEVTLVNASVRWYSADGKYQFTLGGKNLTDDEYLRTGYQNEAIGHIERLYDRGIQWYLSGRYDF
ncbi:MAG: TonB-dependent receptor [Pseudomonadota bacterium]